MKNLPIGIQEFEKLRTQNCIYVDKTELLYKLVTTGYTYFLSRPRRFGKSLTVSTLKELFKGNKVLFENTWIYDKWNWTETFPVIKISFSNIDHQTLGLRDAINRELDALGNEFNIKLDESTIALKFKELIMKLSKINKVAVLIDEYDKPITDYIEQQDIAVANRDIMRNFYSVLKDADSYIKFLFITGVSKFAKVSIFSELNHLSDLTFNSNYSTLTGYTISEIQENFDEYLTKISNDRNTTKEQLLSQIIEWYNGYSWDGRTKVCNPFGILNFLNNNEFRDYWFASATPTYLLRMLKKYHYQPYELDNSVVSMSIFDKYDFPNIELKSLLVETGYLTIKEKLNDQELRIGYPNREVAQSFSVHLLANIVEKNTNVGENLLYEMRQALITNKLDVFELYFNSLFSNITYHQFVPDERYFHSIFYLVVKMLGFYIESEVLTNLGRIDSVIKTKDYIYIIEYKKGASKTALQQIKDKKYHEKYIIENKPIYLIGIGFNLSKRTISKMAIEKL